MTMEQIILLAREAGFSVSWPETVVNFARFAALIAAAEREACAKEAENEWNFDVTECGIDVANDIAAAIRARGRE